MARAMESQPRLTRGEARRAELEARLAMLRNHRTKLLAELAEPGNGSAERAAASETTTRGLSSIKRQIARIGAALLAGPRDT